MRCSILRRPCLGPILTAATYKKQANWSRLRSGTNKFILRPAIGYLIAINSHYAPNMTSIALEAAAQSTVSLASLHKGAQGSVVTVREDGAALGDETGGTIVMRLIELGFVPGEAFEVIAESLPGGDPIAVRIGGSCFALRRREAAAVMVSVIAS